MPPRSAKSRSSAAHPAHALGVEPVGGLVEDQHLGVAEQRVREPEPLAHAERVLAHALARGRAVEADEPEQLVGALLGHAHQPRGQRERLAPAAAGVLGGGVEQDADAAAGVGERAVGAAEHGGAAGVGLGEPARASAWWSSCRRRWVRGTR